MNVSTCPGCEKECDAKRIDDGIGHYEFGGQKGVHHDYIWVSDCCEETLEDFDPGDWEDEAAISNAESRADYDLDRYPY